MRRYWYVWTLFAIVGVLGIVIARVQWAASVPSRPNTLPATAIWIPSPPAPLDFSPRGYWLACWLDAIRNVNRCKLTDYKGNPKLEADYLSTAGPNPVPETRLHLKPVSSTTELWVPVGEETVPVARLEDGTVLVPAQYLSQLRQRFASK